MSLCLFKYLNNGNLLIAGDSRACSYDDSELEYVSDDNIKKIYKINKNSVTFTSGIAHPLVQTIKEFKGSNDHSPENLANILKENTQKIPDYEIPKSKRNLKTCIMLATVKSGKVVCYLISDACGYKPIMFDKSSGDRGTIDSPTEEINKFFQDNIATCQTTNEAVEIFKQTYQKSNSYQIGGTVTIYELGCKGISSEFTYHIKDTQIYRRTSQQYNTMYNLKGLNVNDNFIIDEDGRVTINNGNISFSSVSGTEDLYDKMNNIQNTANKAKTIAQQIADGEYKGGTFINGNKIYSPIIYSNEFNVLPSGTEEGSFNIYGYFGKSLMNMFKLEYMNMTEKPIVYFSSPVGAPAMWNFSKTYFSGDIDFGTANVTGLTAKFA